jgi:hypothetical protein
MKHTVGFPLDTPEDEAIAQALDIAEAALREEGSEVPLLGAEVVRDDEHAANGEFVVVVRGGAR